MRLFPALLLLLMIIPACKSKEKMVQEKSGSQLVVVEKKPVAGDKAVITGIMRDAETNEPIIYGVVFLKSEGNSPIGMTTNMEGRFEMSNVPGGKYQLEAKFIGCETLSAPSFTGCRVWRTIRTTSSIFQEATMKQLPSSVFLRNRRPSSA
jgi:hypothetical protein